jgi:hypothetical protein
VIDGASVGLGPGGVTAGLSSVRASWARGSIVDTVPRRGTRARRRAAGAIVHLALWPAPPADGRGPPGGPPRGAGCGTACKDGEVCSKGACALECAGGATKCGDLCVDTQLDAANCGACGAACGADESCTQGACGIACVAGSTLCDEACVDLQNRC